MSERGEVDIFEGWLSSKEARKAKAPTGKDEGGSPPAVCSAMTQSLTNYIELHRHVAVRLNLLESPKVVLRLLIAHGIASSGNWSVKWEPQRSHSDAIRDSIESSAAQLAFDTEKVGVDELLGLAESDEANSERTTRVFMRLPALTDHELERIAAFTMAETLALGSEATPCGI